MLERMFSEHKFKAAVFIGGMGGIIQEYEMFRRLQPEAAVIPVISKGGATLDVGAQVESLAPDLPEDRDSVALFHRHLDVSVRGDCFDSPALQPALEIERAS